MVGQDLTEELARKLGQAGASVLGRGADRPALVLGRDTRASGPALEAALAEGIRRAGCDVLQVGVLPSPAIAYLVRDLGASGGVVISASHNPAEYNGIKFFDSAGYKLADAVEDEVAGLLDEDAVIPGRSEAGTSRQIDDAADRYIRHAVSCVPCDLRGMRIALDCAHGAASSTSPEALRRLGAEVTVICSEPDGKNINADCGSTHPQRIRDVVAAGGFDIGLTHDGDADRVLAVDEGGELVDGDFLMAVCARHLHEDGRLPNDVVVTTVMTNMGFDHAMRSAGVEVLKTKVGDRYVLEEMQKTGSMLGGEQSGHIIFLDCVTTGDGLVTALRLLEVMRETGRPLSELKTVMSRFPQVLLNLRVPGKQRLADSEAVWKKVAEVEERLDGRGRVLVRSSGTEPLVRVMVECDHADEADAAAREIADVVERELG